MSFKLPMKDPYMKDACEIVLHTPMGNMAM